MAISNVTNGSIESREDYKDDPSGQYKYWVVELDASATNFKSFTRQGNQIVKRYLAGDDAGGQRDSDGVGFRLNLFYANTSTLQDTLYGSVPTIDVARRYADSSDDVGRVAAELLERILNNDIAENGEECDNVLRQGLNDRLTVGLGASRVRYVAEMQIVDGEEQLVHEDAKIDYVHWRDVRWGWTRSFAEVPWIGFRAYLTKDEVTDRFGEDVAKELTYKVQQALSDDANDSAVSSNDDNSDAWQKAEVWEIWDKLKRQVVWVSQGYDKVLDTKEDPLGLNGFYPCPPFFIANVTSTLYVPTADYHLAQDLYNEVDKLQSRISIITDAVKVVGLYDSTNGEIGRMMEEGKDNDLIPVDNWAIFAEKGGIQGQVDWFPIQDVVAALSQLIGIRDQTIGMLQQITGMSDLMRGQLDNQYEGVGQSQLKAQMGSVKIQALQDKFAQYATDLLQLKAEVISKHFSPETIIQRSNAESIFDTELVPTAVELIKDFGKAKLSVKIRPESVAMVDYAQMKNERTEYINALSTFMQSAAPLIESDPKSKPFLLQLLQWGLAGFKGASEIEGVIDKAIEAAQEQADEPESDIPPELQVEQMRQKFQMELEQFKDQAEQKKIQAKAEADLAVRNADMRADITTMQQQQQADMQTLQAEMVKELTSIQAKLRADVEKEVAQARANIAQQQGGAEAEVQKDLIAHELDIDKSVRETELKIAEIAASAEAKIKEKKVDISEAKNDSKDD